MNVKLLFRMLGILSILIGVFMLFSLIWAFPKIGFHTDPIPTIEYRRWERYGVIGLCLSSFISCVVGGLFLRLGRNADRKLFRKEAMAIVGLSWVLATVLGALPYMLSGTSRGPSVRLFAGNPDDGSRLVLVTASRLTPWKAWRSVEVESPAFEVLQAITSESARGLSRRQLIQRTGYDNAPEIVDELVHRSDFADLIIVPGQVQTAPADRASHYRLAWVKMGLIDSMFESQSGFSTTGATVLCDLEDPHLVPHCILFWRATTHYLGGLGIIALFVVLLGHGSAGKSLMRTEMPGPTQDNSTARMQHTAWIFASTYTALNVVLAMIFVALGMSVFDATCHAFATMATGGFSTYNASLGHFLASGENGKAIEYVTMIFMLLAGSNFALLVIAVTGNPLQMLRDLEFRTYLGIIGVVGAMILITGIVVSDPGFGTFEKGFRNSFFQVISIITTTGYGTADFDQWSHFSRGVLLMLMFVGGCAGSTGGGMKVIRYVLFVKIMGIEIEHAYHPTIVRPLRISGKAVEDQTLRRTIMVYFGIVTAIFAFGFLFVILVEPTLTWGTNYDNKLIDSASAVASTLNNIGPGLGLVGATQNYASFSALTKMLFIWLMMLGRLEIFPILILFMPGFWRTG